MASNGTALHDTHGQHWEKLAAEYTALTAPTNRLIIGSMLSHANALLPFAKASGILDNGCGPGPVMKRILEDYGTQLPNECSLMCADFSEPMLKQVEADKAAALESSPWKRVRVEVQNAMELTAVQTASVSHVTAGLVYFMTPNPMKCLTESRRVLRDGGVLALSSWQRSQWVDLTLAVQEIKPEMTMPVLPAAWTSVEGVVAEMQKAGFEDVEVHEVPCEMSYQSHEELVHGMVTRWPHIIAMSNHMSQGELQRFEESMVRKAKMMNPSAPGALRGVALVGLGRK